MAQASTDEGCCNPKTLEQSELRPDGKRPNTVSLSVSKAIIVLRTNAIVDVSLALLRAAKRFGMSTAARTLITAMTIKSSSKVKPEVDFCIEAPL